MAVLLAVTSGCASIRGTQEPLTQADLDRHIAVCPSENQLKGLERHDGEADGHYRDRIIMVCVKAINFKFTEFTIALSQESGIANLATDLIAQGLATGASVVDGADLAKKLAAGAALSIGVGATINKDLFYKQTLPAIVASMEAKRSKILTEIAKSQNADRAAKVYTLDRAGYDLDMLERAGSMTVAISELTSAAVKNANQAEEDRQEAERDLYAGVLQDVPVEMKTRIRGAYDALEKLYADGAEAKLHQIATNLAANPRPDDDLAQLRARIRYQITMVWTEPDGAKRDEKMRAIERQLGIPEGGDK